MPEKKEQEDQNVKMQTGVSGVTSIMTETWVECMHGAFSNSTRCLSVCSGAAVSQNCGP